MIQSHLTKGNSQDRRHRRNKAGSEEIESQKENYDTDKSDNPDSTSNGTRHGLSSYKWSGDNFSFSCCGYVGLLHSWVWFNLVTLRLDKLQSRANTSEEALYSLDRMHFFGFLYIVHNKILICTGVFVLAFALVGALMAFQTLGPALLFPWRILNGSNVFNKCSIRSWHPILSAAIHQV